MAAMIVSILVVIWVFGFIIYMCVDLFGAHCWYNEGRRRSEWLSHMAITLAEQGRHSEGITYLIELVRRGPCPIPTFKQKLRALGRGTTRLTRTLFSKK